VIGRWLPFAVAALASTLAATGFGFAASQLVTPRTPDTPQLRTVSSTTLARLGLSLSSAGQPPYCGLAEAAEQDGWLRQGTAGCAITQPTAEATARQGGRARVIESVLAQVTSGRGSAGLHDHLTWVVVTQTSLSGCQQSHGYSFCFSTHGGWNQLVLVDARSAGVITSLRLSPAGWASGPFPRGFPTGATLSTG